MPRHYTEHVIIGDQSHRRRINPLYSIFVRCFMCFCCFVVVCFIIATLWDDNSKNKSIGDENTPLIVLYHGKPEKAPYEWNTGVWPSWGEHNGDMYKNQIKQRLNWQAEGAIVHKSCDVHCHISHDQNLVSKADAVVMEIVNHYKFYGKDTNLPIPWPNQIDNKPLLGMFHYESDSEYNFLKNETFQNKIDFTIIPKPYADIPITLICNWGFPTSKYLTKNHDKITNTEYNHKFESQEVFVADFRGVVPPEHRDMFNELHELVNIDSFEGPYKNANAPEPYILENRIKHMGEYLFVIISESIIENDWICPEFSQCLLSGAVPIYFGAPNIDKYVPGYQNSIINGNDFDNAQQLADYINKMGNDRNLYESTHFAWKDEGLTLNFKNHLSNCVHITECRICKKVLELMAN